MDERDPDLFARAVDPVESLLWSYFDPQVSGLERVPPGPALFVGNHNAVMLSPDTGILCVALYRAFGLDEVPYGLAHDIVMTVPGVRQLFARLGAVRARPETGARLFAAGRKALVYPGGDYDSMRPYRDRNRVVFGPRRGYLRLALGCGVPIIPVVAAGAHETLLILDDCRWLAKLLRTDRWLRLKAWPVALSLPWGLTVGPVPPHLPLPTRIFIEILEPITFARSGEAAAGDPAYVEACHGEVMAAMQAGLERVAAERVAAGGKRLL